MSDLESRLEKLQELLGNGVKLAESPHEDSDTAHEPCGNSFGMVMDDEYIRNEERWMIREQVSPEQLRAEAAAARKELFESNKNKAFDNPDFRIGQNVDEEFLFCPFKVVVSYPERFVGKTNKPRVCATQYKLALLVLILRQTKPFFTEILKDRTWDL